MPARAFARGRGREVPGGWECPVAAAGVMRTWPGCSGRRYKRYLDRAREVGLIELSREKRQSADGTGRPRTFPDIEDTIGWPRRRIASVLGGAGRMRQMEFGGRRPYRFHDERRSASGRWEMWMDAGQARAVRAAKRG